MWNVKCRMWNVECGMWNVGCTYNNNNTLFTHATSRSDKNSLKHVRETKNVKRKRNNLKLPFSNLSINLLL